VIIKISVTEGQKVVVTVKGKHIYRKDNVEY
jgi:hypothetical protein